MSQLYNEIKSLRKRVKSYMTEGCSNKIETYNIQDLRVINLHITRQIQQFSNYKIADVLIEQEKKTIRLKDNTDIGMISLLRS